jgi:hypothetical protein
MANLHQFAGDARFGMEIHGLVGLVEVALDAQTLELLGLHAIQCSAKARHSLRNSLHRRHLVLVLALGAVLLLDLPLDRQAVAVPARHVVAVVPAHLERAGDHVLQDLVERMADMDVAVGIGRAVMQHVFRAAVKRLGIIECIVGVGHGVAIFWADGPW